MSAAVTTIVRIDARRPASWLALGAAVFVGWALAGREGPAATPVAVAAAGLLAIAGIGRLPGGRSGPWPRLALLRGGWPIAGFLIGGGAAAAVAGRLPGPACVLAPAAAAVTAILVTVLLETGRPQALAASKALVMAGGGAAAALVVALAGGGAWLQALAAAAAWGLLAASVLLEHPFAAQEWLVTAGAARPRRGVDAALGIAMASSLAAMVGCFFLAPRFAWIYSLHAVGWFVCLAVPTATDAAPGLAGHRLARAATGRPPVPGSLARAVRIAGRWSGVLGWPAVVAAVLPAADGGRDAGPLVALASLAAAAVALLAAVACSARNGRGETARAAVLALAALAAAVGGRAAGFAGSPSLPALRAAASPTRGAISVEPRPVSCETSQPSQIAAASWSRSGRVEIRASCSR